MKPLITPSLLQHIRTDLPLSIATVTAEKLQAAAEKFGITTGLRVSHFLAQIAQESGFRPIEENLRYTSPQRIFDLFQWDGTNKRYRFSSVAECKLLTFNPQGLANVIYADRMGNRGIASGDGWNYRGRGFIQITGRSNYEKYGKLTGFDLLGSPGLALQYGVGALVAAAFWQDHGLNPLADRNDIRTITRRINGGEHGLTDREDYLVLARSFLKV